MAGASDERLKTLIVQGIAWLLERQNDDGGWGDTDKSHSNIATTMLAVAANHLAGVAAAHQESLARAEAYIEAKGRIARLRARYGKDKTFAVPILTNCALAGLVDWRQVSPLPFELACFPQSLYRFLRLPVVSYAIPALVAIGQARYFHKTPLNPFARFVRRLAVTPSLRVLRRMQPASGGYLEAVPLTSFVVMSLAATGRADHPVTASGIRFLLDSVRDDGSWPIDTNLATWNTTLAVNALAGAKEIAKLELTCFDWLLGCQHTKVHPFTGAEPGGWGWSDLSGAVPDADDTAGALLALSVWHEADSCRDEQRTAIETAAGDGIQWLLMLQNRDGGWPTFCRGWGKLPFDRSGADVTAHVLRAIAAGRRTTCLPPRTLRAVDRASVRGFGYLARHQRGDGSWLPLWFGNQDHPQEANPVYGTAKVLLAYRDTNQTDTPAANRGFDWLVNNQNKDGGWGGGPSVQRRNPKVGPSSVEETALAVEALLTAPRHERTQAAMITGLEWLMSAVEAGRHRETWPIGFYFAKLWYHEKLYPLIFTVSALGRAIQVPNTGPAVDPSSAHSNTP
jgi:squalene-hopene/tetraprenyl-beta-curcumene cyclase